MSVAVRDKLRYSNDHGTRRRELSGNTIVECRSVVTHLSPSLPFHDSTNEVSHMASDDDDEILCRNGVSVVV